MNLADLLKSGYNSVSNAVTDNGMYTIPNFFKAINTLSTNAKNNVTNQLSGDTVLPYTVNTGYGQASTQSSLDEFVKRAQAARAAQIAAQGVTDKNNSIYNDYKGQVANGTATTIPFTIAEQMMNDGTLPQSTGNNGQAVLGTSSQAPSATNGYQGIGDFAANWYTSVGHPESAEKARQLAESAAANGMDPYMALALGAQEGGWLNKPSSATSNNYLGWGETDSGSLNKNAGTFQDWLNTYIPVISSQYGTRNNLSDWGGTNSNTYKSKYNYNQSWYNAMSQLLQQENAYKNSNQGYSGLSGSTTNIK